ncbi:uncharacterized protein LOC134217244 [Armigeres subalbatus]|uniref:uncharacterized protein LOC134217244 n=1 Tax=Armigeres subalbatus TaxID=124917 RepID=UPI002ED6B6CC
MREAGQSKDVFKFRHVCSKHFERTAFKNPLIVSLGLQKHAVPTIKTLNPTAVEDNVLDYESQYIELLSSDMTVDTGVVEEQIDYDRAIVCTPRIRRLLRPNVHVAVFKLRARRVT